MSKRFIKSTLLFLCMVNLPHALAVQAAQQGQTSKVSNQQLRISPDKKSLDTELKLKNLEAEVEDLNVRLRIIQGVNQKIGVFNLNELKEKVMVEDLKSLKELTQKKQGEVKSKRFEFELLKSDLELKKPSMTKKELDVENEKLQNFFTYFKNFEETATEELQNFNNEVNNRFNKIVSFALRVFIEKNSDFIFILPSSSFITPKRTTKWPLEIVDIQDEILNTSVRNYFKAEKK